MVIGDDLYPVCRAAGSSESSRCLEPDSGRLVRSGRPWISCRGSDGCLPERGYALILGGGEDGVSFAVFFEVDSFCA